MSQKRPMIRRRPGAPTPGGGGGPAGAGGSGGGAAGGGGLLNSIIGNMKKTNAECKPSGPGARPITKADIMTREEKLMDARRAFERTHGDRMRRELVDRKTSDGDDDDGGGEAFIEFPPMDKVWRNILHELASDLRLHSESIELEHPAEGGDKYVVVYSKPPTVELTDAEEARRAAAAAAMKARASASTGMKRGEALTDRAPMMPEGGGIPEGELKVVGTVKRDLRSVAEVSAELRKRKREGGGGE